MASKDEPLAWWKKAILIGLFVVVVGPMVFGSEDENTAEMAFYMSQSFVEKRLKAPGSAEFGEIEEARITQEGETWVVRSEVRSENSFGGMAMHKFEARLDYLPEEERWGLRSLEME